jgi:DNA-directed RNA polymerase
MGRYVLNTSNVRTGKRIAHFNGPNPSSATDIHDLKRFVLRENGVRQGSIQQHREDVVLKIKSVLLCFIVRQQCLTFPVITMAILVDEFEG